MMYEEHVPEATRPPELQLEVERLRVRLAEAEARIRSLMAGRVEATPNPSLEQRRMVQLKVARIFSEGAPLDSAIQQVLAVIAEGTGAAVGELWRPEPGSGELRCDTIWHADRPELLAFERETRSMSGAASGLPGAAFAARSDFPNLRTSDTVLFQRSKAAALAGLTHASAYTIQAGEEPFGVLVFLSRDSTTTVRLAHVMTDIRDHLAQFVAGRRAEQALRETNETLRALIAAAPVAIVVVDLDGRVRIWNPAAERIFGWTKEEVLGKPLPYVPEDSAERQQMLEALWRGEVSSGVYCQRQRRDGRTIDISVSSAPMSGPDHHIVGAVRVIQDVTEQKILESRLGQTGKMEAIGRLAGGVAHDFNNLLTVILSSAEFALEALDQDLMPARQDVEDVKRAAKRAAELTAQLLAFSRRQVLAPRVLDPNALVGGMQTMLRRLIGEDITFRLELSPDVACVWADPHQLEQAFMNLVVNSRDAMPKGGLLTISSANTGAPAGMPAGRYVEIVIRDTGTGMDETTRAHLFEPFFTTKEKGRGTGLGLATVYGIVAQSKGTITVRSEPGRGTELALYFPACASEADAGELGTGDLVRPGRGETILVVEDEDAVRSITSRVLRHHGYEVIEAANGERALEIVSRGAHLDLMITDVVMPGLGGRELSQQVSVLRPDARILFISGYTDDELFRRSLEQSGFSFLPKPFSPVALSKMVRSILDEAR